MWNDSVSNIKYSMECFKRKHGISRKMSVERQERSIWHVKKEMYKLFSIKY